MSTREKIKDIATKHFARYGYEGASMSKIATEVGIKKPSLYAHFESKRDVFEHCMDSAQSEYVNSLSEILNDKKYSSPEKRLFGVLHDFITTNTDKEYYIRFAFMPPEGLEEREKYPNNFIDIMSEILDDTMSQFLAEQARNKNIEIKEKAKEETKEAYLCMLDGLMVEFIFGDSATYNKRLKAAWSVFMKGVK